MTKRRNNGKRKKMRQIHNHAATAAQIETDEQAANYGLNDCIVALTSCNNHIS